MRFAIEDAVRLTGQTAFGEKIPQSWAMNLLRKPIPLLRSMPPAARRRFLFRPCGWRRGAKGGKLGG